MTFSAFLVKDRVSVLVILAILVINKAWFLHFSLELGMFFLQGATFHHYL